MSHPFKELYVLLVGTRNRINIFQHQAKMIFMIYADEKRHIEAYQTLIRQFEIVHIENIKILRTLIYTKDDQLPLFDGANHKRVDGAKQKRVYYIFLLITSPNAG